MKKRIAALGIALLMLGLTGCGSSPEQAAQTLVVYFSATGTTKGIAETIASLTEADLYEITPAQEYTDADLNYSDSGSSGVGNSASNLADHAGSGNWLPGQRFGARASEEEIADWLQ